MSKIKLLCAMLLCAIVLPASAQIWTEGFETDGEGVRYNSSNVFYSNSGDYFGRVTQADISSTLSGIEGSFFWGGEDMDATGSDGLAEKTLTFSSIDVLDLNEVTFTGFFASGFASGKWDNTDFVRFEYTFDGIIWTPFLNFTSDIDSFNGTIAEDTDLMGVAEGQALTSTFAAFSKVIPVSGPTLEIRMVASCNSGDEEFAFDLLSVSSDAPVFGCTNPLADNYDATATVDDGTCIVSGCTNDTADNYDPTATVDDGSCVISGCTDATASNYNPDATIDDGSCTFVTGCTDPTAFNFDPLAVTDDGSCIANGPTLVINEIHYNPCTAQGDDFDWEFIELLNNGPDAIDVTDFTFSAGIDFTFPLGTMIAAGEYVLVAANPMSYDMLGVQVFGYANGGLSNGGELVEISNADGFVVDSVEYGDGFDTDPWPSEADGGCASIELIDDASDNSLVENWQPAYVENGTPGAQNSDAPEGCTDPAASNFDPAAVVDDGSCDFLGCTDAAASNFDPMATTDDGSCIFPGCTYAFSPNYDPMFNLDDGSCTCEGGTSDCPADVDGNLMISIGDLLAVSGQLGSACP